MATTTSKGGNGDSRPVGTNIALEHRHEDIGVGDVGQPSNVTLLIVFDTGQEIVVDLVGQVLRQAIVLVTSREEVEAAARDIVTAIHVDIFLKEWSLRDEGRTTIALCHVGGQISTLTSSFTELCDFEYLYEPSFVDRQDLSRFLGFVLGQQTLADLTDDKERTTALSLRLSNISIALPDLEILAIGADAIELRVDALEDSLTSSGASSICSLTYVKEQLILLRRRTALPVIFTLRTEEATGRSLSLDATLVSEYLLKALQWGCEYIDVELWLPLNIRQTLYRRRGSSRLISSFFDRTGSMRWSATETLQCFREAARFSDIVKMDMLGSSTQDFAELDSFRLTVRDDEAAQPFSGVILGPPGQARLSHHTIFASIMHPLLPIESNANQPSAADLNKTLHAIGAPMTREFYGVGSAESSLLASFFKKCFNELGLPHQIVALEREPDYSSLLRNHRFGGLYLERSTTPRALPSVHLSEAAELIGHIDTIPVRTYGTNRLVMGDNAAWMGIYGLLTRDHTPSAYLRSAVLVIADSQPTAGAALYALKMLKTGLVYTVGFECTGALSVNTRELATLDSIASLNEAEQPTIIINALAGRGFDRVRHLLRNNNQTNPSHRPAARVLIDLAQRADDVGYNSLDWSSGWVTYDTSYVRAWTTMEMMKLLVGQNVPSEFVRLACGNKSF